MMKYNEILEYEGQYKEDEKVDEWVYYYDNGRKQYQGYYKNDKRVDKWIKFHVDAGKKVKRIYIEETCEIKKEFYLSCLVDRSSSKIAFISSIEGGVDIEN